MTVRCDSTMLIASKAGKFLIVCFIFEFSEIYHAPRMQHVTAVLWSLDNKYVLSGSDEFNIRLWKANASEKLGPVSFHKLFLS